MLSSFKRAYSWLGVVLILAGILCWFLASGGGRLIETDVMALLPTSQHNPVAQAGMDRVSQELERKVLFLIEASDRDRAVLAAAGLVQGLKKMDLFAEVDGRVDADRQSAWADLYFSKRFQLLTETQRARLRLEPGKQVERVQAQLYSPFSGITGGELRNDPFLLFREFLSGLLSSSGSFTLIDGFPGRSEGDKTFILITAEIADSAYGMNGGKRLPDLFALEQGLRDAHGVEVYHTGVLFYVAEGIESAHREISTIGFGSLAGILLLLVVTYRSSLPIGLSLLSIGCGLLAAFVVTVGVFGRIHLFSLVFGASLIGISIDYAFHYLTYRLAAGPDWDPDAGLRAIFAAITIGLITSLMGYAGLLAAPFPGLQQLAVFSTVGLTAAYATVVCWYPVLAAKPSAHLGLPWVAPMKVWLSFWQKSMVRVGLPVLLVGLSIPGLLRVQFDDDVRQLQALSPELRTQEHAIQEVMGMLNGPQMLLVTGESEQQVLEKLNAVSETLNNWVEQDLLTGFQSLATYLPAASIQRENFDLVRLLYTEQGPHLQETLGFSEAPIWEAEFAPLTPAEFLASPVSEPFDFMWQSPLTEKETGSIILLSGVTSEASLREFFANDPNVYYLDKASDISGIFAAYRVRIMILLLIASCAIWVLLAVRYGFGRGTRMVLPPIIAGIFSLSIAGLSGTPLNIFNLLALAIVLGVGIDYTLFFAEQGKGNDAELLSTQLSISLSAATTILSFGLLALSATQAIHCFGITVLIGIFTSWLLAPLAMTVAPKKGRVIPCN